MKTDSLKQLSTPIMKHAKIKTDYFYNRETIDLSHATRKTKVHFTSQWRNSIAQTPKLGTYKLFKNAHTTDQYILLNLQKNERSMLAQLRCGILQLRIETGRYTGEPADSRLCIFCDSSEIENECHFVTSCSLYNTLRYTLRSNIFGEVLNSDPVIQLSPNEKLTYLMSNYVRKLAKFIAKAYTLRRKTIYSEP